MNDLFRMLWTEDDGVLSFEWTLLITLTTLGIVGGLAAARDAVIDELGDAAQAMVALDGSYRVDYPLQLSIAHDGGPAQVVGRASDSVFIDFTIFNDCGRILQENAP